MALPLFDLDKADDRRAFDRLVDRLRRSTADVGAVAETVAPIVDHVREGGDEALVRYMRKFADPEFTAEMIRVDAGELAAAAEGIDSGVRDAMAGAIEHVRRYQQQIMPADVEPVEIDGARLGLRFTPMDRVGLHVPGGRAAYPSSVIMLAVPAQVAGVEGLSVVSPPPTMTGDEPASARRDISPLVLAACHMLGLDEVYRIGGAQAIAALAFGTETVGKVDFIAGPGNAFVQMAKKQLFGLVGIDGFFGPSEVVVLIDDTADAACVAGDLLAQAEHDPGCCFLVSSCRGKMDEVLTEVKRQLPERQRREAISNALQDWSAAVLVPDGAAAIETVNTLAAEHVLLAVADPEAMLRHIRHGGAFFLGDGSPVPSGDYYAGPSHCLPTGTTARYSSGLSVYTFLKRSSVEQYPDGPPAEAIDAIARLAEAEGLDAHAAAVRLRRRNSPGELA